MTRDHEQDYETKLTFGAGSQTVAPKEPSYEVTQKQDAGHTESDFLHDLTKATRRVERRSERG